jgi:hypothetical protein
MEPTAEQLQQYILIGKIIIGLVPLATIAQLLLNIYNSRRKPSVAEELYRDFATKKELADLRVDFRETMNEFFTRQHQNQSATDDKFNSIMRSIGVVEGEIKKCPHFCKQ